MLLFCLLKIMLCNFLKTNYLQHEPFSPTSYDDRDKVYNFPYTGYGAGFYGFKY